LVVVKKLNPPYNKGVCNGEPVNVVLKEFENDRKWNEWFRENTYLNCWHMNEKESIGMWNLYTPGGLGICIQSTFNRLKECFSETSEMVQIGPLEYIDMSSGDVDIPDGNKFYPFVYKDASFKHENEIRAVVCDRMGQNGGREVTDKPQYEFARNVKVNLNKLVEKIYVTPSSHENWLADILRSIVEKYGYNFQVSTSELIREPYFG
jgi:hypothetical protein